MIKIEEKVGHISHKKYINGDKSNPDPEYNLDDRRRDKYSKSHHGIDSLLKAFKNVKNDNIRPGYLKNDQDWVDSGLPNARTNYQAEGPERDFNTSGFGNINREYKNEKAPLSIDFFKSNFKCLKTPNDNSEHSTFDGKDFYRKYSKGEMQGRNILCVFDGQLANTYTKDAHSGYYDFKAIKNENSPSNLYLNPKGEEANSTQEMSAAKIYQGADWIFLADFSTLNDDENIRFAGDTVDKRHSYNDWDHLDQKFKTKDFLINKSGTIIQKLIGIGLITDYDETNKELTVDGNKLIKEISIVAPKAEDAEDLLKSYDLYKPNEEIKINEDLSNDIGNKLNRLKKSFSSPKNVPAYVSKLTIFIKWMYRFLCAQKSTESSASDKHARQLNYIDNNAELRYDEASTAISDFIREGRRILKETTDLSQKAKDQIAKAQEKLNDYIAEKQKLSGKYGDLSNSLSEAMSKLDELQNKYSKIEIDLAEDFIDETGKINESKFIKLEKDFNDTLFIINDIKRILPRVNTLNKDIDKMNDIIKKYTNGKWEEIKELLNKTIKRNPNQDAMGASDNMIKSDDKYTIQKREPLKSYEKTPGVNIGDTLPQEKRWSDYNPDITRKSEKEIAKASKEARKSPETIAMETKRARKAARKEEDSKNKNEDLEEDITMEQEEQTPAMADLVQMLWGWISALDNGGYKSYGALVDELKDDIYIAIGQAEKEISAGSGADIGNFGKDNAEDDDECEDGECKDDEVTTTPVYGWKPVVQNDDEDPETNKDGKQILTEIGEECEDDDRPDGMYENFDENGDYDPLSTDFEKLVYSDKEAKKDIEGKNKEREKTVAGFENEEIDLTLKEDCDLDESYVNSIDFSYGLLEE